MTAIYRSNSPLGLGELPPINDNNADLFSEKIDYSSPDTRMNVPSQFNGNISAVTWHVAGRDNQAYGFKYDDLDILTEANYFDISETYSGNQAFSNFSTDNKFQEKQTYDLRGNITSLQRNGYKLGAWTSNGYTAANYGLIDNLTYTYNAQNQVIRINDAAVNPNSPHGDKDLKGFVYDFAVGATMSDYYTYDANGNLKSDKHKGITNIDYNYLNLPQTIMFSDGNSINFVYSASGEKLQKVVIIDTEPTTTDYVNGVEYQDGALQRMAHTEGAVVRQSNGTYLHKYVLRDHLGNTRVTFTDADNNGIVGESDIKQINHYYPFGLNMEGNWNGAAGTNKYQYNGKEWNDDLGLGWNDYGARFYTPDAPRWTTIDPLAEQAHSWTPYRYGFDNPIKFTDPTGMKEDGIGLNKDGEIVYNDYKNDGNYYYFGGFKTDNPLSTMEQVEKAGIEYVQVANNFEWVKESSQGGDYGFAKTFIRSIFKYNGQEAELNNVGFNNIYFNTPAGNEQMAVVTRLYNPSKDDNAPFTLDVHALDLNITSKRDIFDIYKLRSMSSHEGKHVSDYMKLPQLKEFANSYSYNQFKFRMEADAYDFQINHHTFQERWLATTFKESMKSSRSVYLLYLGIKEKP